MPQNNKLIYSSSIKDMSFLFLEMQKAAKLFVEGASLDLIAVRSVTDNIFQLDKERRRLSLAHKVVSRLSVLTEKQIAVLAGEYGDIAKLIAFYAILKTDLLFFGIFRILLLCRYTHASS